MTQSIKETQSVGHWFGQAGVTFRVWAPKAKQLDLEIRDDDRSQFLAMQRADDGYWAITSDLVTHGTDYRYRVDGEQSFPDPTARCYVDSVHGWVRAWDHEQFDWQTDDYLGVAKKDLVIYELHIGTFTKTGTLLSAVERLDELVELGVTAVELLPLAQCPGRWNWGYDGVGIFAVQNTLGTPDDLKRFVDACHSRDLAVILDVVYNHIGPEGNYLSQFGPYFTKKRATPWGDAINFDDRHSEHVRQFFIDNAVYWMREYRLDGLRLDAVHFMFDDSAEPISMSITRAVDQLRQATDWPIHLIGETNVQNALLVRSSSHHETGFDAVWSDCAMHCIIDIAQPGLNLSHRDYSSNDLVRSLHQGFLWESFPYVRHDAGDRADLDSFVIGLQNHDTVGNHPQGLRLHQIASVQFQMAAAAIAYLHPAIPMIFMGEEFATEKPFLFFADFADDWVRKGVVEGREAQFPELSNLVGTSPLSPAAMRKSRIGESSKGNDDVRQWYRSLIGLRKRFVESGLLEQSKLVVTGNADRGYFQLEYQSETEHLKIEVALASPGTTFEPIPIACVGEVLMTTATDRHHLNANQTVISLAQLD